MRATVDVNGIKIILEAENPDEVMLLSRLIRDLIDEGRSARSDGDGNRKASESGLHKARVEMLEDLVLAIGEPVNAPRLAQMVRNAELFKTAAGDPIHVVRRTLNDDRFEKTVSGLFAVKGMQTRQIVPPEIAGETFEDDLDDPFAED